jgi:hypothetical protein
MVSEDEPVSLPMLDTLPNNEHEPRKVSLVQLTQTANGEAILGLDEQKGPGPDGILPSTLKESVSVFKVPLALLFNLSLSTGIFPAVWKESFVVPIFKSGEKRDISCYRGICILSVIPKLFEKMICNEITPIIRPQISVMQHGFMKEQPCYNS